MIITRTFDVVASSEEEAMQKAEEFLQILKSMNVEISVDGRSDEQ